MAKNRIHKPMNEYLTVLDALNVYLDLMLVIGIELLFICVTAVMGLLQEEDNKAL